MRLRTSSDMGAAIREKRRALGWDQRTLATKVGVSRQWVIEVEKGKPRAAMKLVLRALEVLGIVLRAEDAGVAAEAGTLSGSSIDLDEVVRAHRRPKGKAR